jgi:hypothetical protein
MQQATRETPAETQEPRELQATAQRFPWAWSPTPDPLCQQFCTPLRYYCCLIDGHRDITHNRSNLHAKVKCFLFCCRRPFSLLIIRVVVFVSGEWHGNSNEPVAGETINHALILPSSQNKCNSMTEHVNQYGCKMTKLPIVFYEKDLGIDLSFVQEISRDSCLLWLVSQSCILCETM